MRIVSFFFCLACLVLIPHTVWGADVGRETLSNQDVIDLFQAGLDKALILDKIKKTESTFDLSTEQLILLKKAKVPDEIISLMLQKSASQESKTRSKIHLYIQQMASARAEVREMAAASLRRMGSQALPKVRESLTHSIPGIRAAAARFLGEVGDAKSAALLRNLLTDGNREARLAAAESLALLRDEVSLRLARSTVVSGSGVLDGYIHLLGASKDVQSTGFLTLHVLENTDPETRQEATWALGAIGASEALDALEHALINDRTLEVRQEAVRAVAKIRQPRSVKPLIRACKRDPDSRVIIIQALSAFSSEEIVEFLIYTLQHRLTVQEQEAVLSSLRKLTHQDFGPDYGTWLRWWEQQRGNSDGVMKPLSPATPDTAPSTPARPVVAPPPEETSRTPAPVSPPPGYSAPEETPAPPKAPLESSSSVPATRPAAPIAEQIVEPVDARNIRAFQVVPRHGGTVRATREASHSNRAEKESTPASRRFTDEELERILEKSRDTEVMTHWADDAPAAPVVEKPADSTPAPAASAASTPADTSPIAEADVPVPLHAEEIPVVEEILPERDTARHAVEEDVYVAEAPVRKEVPPAKVYVPHTQPAPFANTADALLVQQGEDLNVPGIPHLVRETPVAPLHVEQARPAEKETVVQVPATPEREPAPVVVTKVTPVPVSDASSRTVKKEEPHFDRTRLHRPEPVSRNRVSTNAPVASSRQSAGKSRSWRLPPPKASSKPKFTTDPYNY